MWLNEQFCPKEASICLYPYVPQPSHGASGVDNPNADLLGGAEEPSWGCGQASERALFLLIDC